VSRTIVAILVAAETAKYEPVPAAESLPETPAPPPITGAVGPAAVAIAVAKVAAVTVEADKLITIPATFVRLCDVDAVTSA